MAIDIRARVTCNLGDVISASISDDYIQGNGLIKTSGSCQIKGIVNPRVGDVVVFQYTKSGITRRVPRTMRVLSYFADPFRRVTSIELGCKLTYLQDLKDPIKWEPLDDPENGNRTPEEEEIVTIPIRASSVMLQCLSALGLSATSIPLTNRFSVPEFDFGGGYVSTLSDLLVSESYCGYLDEAERLIVFSLSATGGVGPLIKSDDLIDIGPIGVGQLPGDAVSVSYSTLKLKPPEDEEIVCRTLTPEEEEALGQGEEDEEGDEPEGGGPEPSGDESRWGDDLATSFSTSQVPISWEDPESGASRVKIFPVLNTTEQRTTYNVFNVYSDDGTRQRRNLATQRITKETQTSIGIAGNVASQYLSNGIEFNVFQAEKIKTDTYTYDDRGNEIRSESETVGNSVYDIGPLGIDFVYDDGYVILTGANISIEKIITISETRGSYSSSFTSRYVTWPNTVYGNQAIANAKPALKTSVDASAYINSLYSANKLFLVSTSGSSNFTGSRGTSQQAPLKEDVINDKYADKPSQSSLDSEEEEEEEETVDPNNGYSTESKSEIEFAYGSRFATRRIELSMPYAPDDTFRRRRVSSSGEPKRYCYYASKSDAAAKASRFGRAQNRMLLGNRSGMNIQIVPEKLPSAPFAPVYIEAAGTIALYRVNAASWTMDSNGIIASTDAMFWGTAGRVS